MRVNRSTNLQITRFVAACMVLITHAYAIIDGNLEREPLYILTKGQITLGGVAVSIFFLCGGYLTAKGVEKQSSFKEYIFSRLKRILPTLIFVVICCIFVGGFITSYSTKEYLTDVNTYKYLLNGIMIPIHYLPGVFENSAYNPTVNGSLWTLPVEFVCNIGCYLMFKMKLTSKNNFKYTIPLVVVGSIFIWIMDGKVSILREILRPCILFYLGMLYWCYREKIKKNEILQIVLIVVLGISIYTPFVNLAIILCLPYIMIMWWFNSKQNFEKISNIGNYSYSMYLWGFPVQQFIGYIFEWEMSVVVNIVSSILLTIVLGVVTYYGVEQKVLRRNK